MTRTIRTFALSSCIALAAACGGGDSGVDEDKAIADLTDDEYVELCEASADDGPTPEQVQYVTCYITGLLQSEDEAGCQELVDACLEEDPEPADECDANDFDPPSCAADITVGEVNDCNDA